MYEQIDSTISDKNVISVSLMTENGTSPIFVFNSFILSFN